jgi:hypothetical protein
MLLGLDWLPKWAGSVGFGPLTSFPFFLLCFLFYFCFRVPFSILKFLFEFQFCFGGLTIADCDVDAANVLVRGA